jgi:hypothetical protein
MGVLKNPARTTDGPWMEEPTRCWECPAGFFCVVGIETELVACSGCGEPYALWNTSGNDHPGLWSDLPLEIGPAGWSGNPAVKTKAVSKELQLGGVLWAMWNCYHSCRKEPPHTTFDKDTRQQCLACGKGG